MRNEYFFQMRQWTDSPGEIGPEVTYGHGTALTERFWRWVIGR